MNEEIIRQCVQIIEEMRKEYVPIDTGNMAFNALRMEISENEIRIYVDETIAPYAPYTEYPWVSPRWKGKKNPNEGWWEAFFEELARRIAATLRGKISYA